jgi:subtilisin family serine protease
MKKLLLILLFVGLMVMSGASVILAQDGVNPEGGTSIFLPLVNNGGSSGSIPTALSQSHAAIPKSENGVYVVIMRDAPAITYVGGSADLGATKPQRGEKLSIKSPEVQAYANSLVEMQNATLQSVGGSQADLFYNYTMALNGFAAKLTPAQVAALQSNPNVLMVLPDVMRYPTTDSTPRFLGLTGKHGAWESGYDGEGIVVGVIDTGIWPEHPSFADDGTYPPPPTGPLPCEFGNTAHNPNDAPFTCNNKLIGARQMLTTYRAFIGADPDEFDSARDDNGHGTHTASTAAGNMGVEASIYGISRGKVSGMAPRAHIIAYKGLGNLGGFGSDLAAAIDQAVADGVDVINYSVGGGPSLLGPDDIAYLFAADSGVYVATSAGNSGPGPGTIGGPASVPWITSVGASTQKRAFQGSASSSDGWEYFGASITGSTAELPLVDAADAGSELCYPGALDPNMVAGNIVLCKRGAIARVAKSYAVYLAGGAGMILYNANDSQSMMTDNHWVPSVHINNTDGMAIKAYIASTASPVAQINGGEKVKVKAPWMAAFSSRGPDPVAEDIIKPDITAPGVQILAGNSPFPDPGELPGELFQAIAGTSMSSPHVAGVFALIKQAHPDWSPAMAKSALMTSAKHNVKKEDGKTKADPFDMGAGHLNPGRPDKKGSAFDPGLVYDAGFFDYLGFLCDAAPEAFADPAGTCGFLASIGVPTDASDLNLPSIGIAQLPGSQTVVRTVTNVSGKKLKMEAEVKAPKGYKVEVNPKKLTLMPGESASFWVTITNKGKAPIGEWAFGSLTWEGNDYKVYSPIAVRAALFDAPTAISGSGETGSASFNVKFGYSGSYSAAAHGLVPATVTADTVVQDPDQSFDPNDGYSNLHQFTLSGAAFFRIAMPPEAVNDPNIDLDIFVFDPNGSLVASSTSGGTDELIDIPSPMDGVWSVFVHGWQTAGPSADYDLYTWILSATPGGNLVISSAPTAATIGTTGTVNLSWSGATLGQWHLGAVSHTGDTGLMGLTLVEVDNR